MLDFVNEITNNKDTSEQTNKNSNENIITMINMLN